MKVFLRTFNPYINSKSGKSLKAGKKRSGTAEWKTFESVLYDVLKEMGCDLVMQFENPMVEDEPEEANYRIYAHKTKRDIEDGHLFYMQMHMSNLFTVDSLGWGADHSRMQSKPEFENIDEHEAELYCEKLKKQFITTGLSKHAQPGTSRAQQIFRRFGLLLPSRYPKDFILVPLQIPRDYVAKYHASITVIDFIHLISTWADNVRQNIVFKLHPYNVNDPDIIDIVKGYSESNNYIHCLEGNIHYLIDKSIGVFTINSGVGFEALIHGKPVVTFGNCDYKWVTYNCDPGFLDKAQDYICAYSSQQKNNAKKFVYHYCSKHAYSINEEHIGESRLRLKEYLKNIIV